MTAAADVTVVIPTLGRARLDEILQTLAAATEHPAAVVVVDDRARPERPLALPLVPGLAVRLLSSGGRGPAAARNVGWVASDSVWIAFVDDDVQLAPDWLTALLADLTPLPPTMGASTARIAVPPPVGRRPTDEERQTLGLTRARWVTADMAYRREALLETGGFDEHFRRAFREDADLALRLQEAGYGIAAGTRVTVHPLRSRGGWRASLSAQRGNADNARLRARFGPGWRRRIGGDPGRTAEHLLTVAFGSLALGAAAVHRPVAGRLAAIGWTTLTGRFALQRILPGPRTAPEVATMLLTSVLIPPAALAWRAVGELDVLRTRRARSPRAVLFDRDGTLIHDVPYLADPEGVRPVAGAADQLRGLRAAGMALGVVSNQSGVARGLIRPTELVAVNHRVDALLGPFDTWQVCPHGPQDGCCCRKPAAGLVREAARSLRLRPRDCVVIGDIGADVQAALRAGARAVLVPTPATRDAEIAHARRNAAVAADLAAAIRIARGGSR